VIFYRQNKQDGTVAEAYWLTDFSIQEVDSQALFCMAKSRWEIENQGFNEAKNLHGLEHLCHHHPNSMLVVWLLTATGDDGGPLVSASLPASRNASYSHSH